MAANPIVVAKANQLFPEINFGFMSWLQGSIVPSLFCAICIPLIIRWSLGLNTDTPTRGKHARGGENVIQHAQMELHKMGPVSLKEWASSNLFSSSKCTHTLYSNSAWCYWDVWVCGSPLQWRTWTLHWWHCSALLLSYTWAPLHGRMCLAIQMQ